MNSLEGSDGHKSVRTSLKNLSDSQTESMNVKDHWKIEIRWIPATSSAESSFSHSSSSSEIQK